MTDQTRRDAIVASLAAGGFTALAMSAQATPEAAPLTGHEHDWDWLVGRWNVKHRCLKGRLTGSTEWEEFTGSSTLWLTLGGLGTIDDNVMERPAGTFRAVGIRAFDVKTGLWSIWWLDPRSPNIDPPVRGGFKNGIGTFSGPDTLNGRPIMVRYTWSAITPTSAHWEQAYSPDEGVSWEVNWRMDFSRQA